MHGSSYRISKSTAACTAGGVVHGTVSGFNVEPPLWDRIDVEYASEKGRIIGFTVIYCAEIHGTWKEVIRYETHHERLHVHRFWRPKAKQVEILETAEPAEDYTQEFEAAKDELKKNWRRYRRLLSEHCEE